MNGYFITNKKRLGFIKTYEINGDSIRLNLDSKKKPSLLKNNVANRIKINEKMDAQIQEAYNYTKKIFFAQIAAYPISLASWVEILDSYAFIVAVAMVGMGILVYYGLDFLDAKKNYDFFKKRSELNNALEQYPNLLEGIKEKTINMLINQPKEEEIFNYNSVDKLTYWELKKILANLKLAKILNLEYAEEQKQPIREEAYTRNRLNRKVIPFK